MDSTSKVLNDSVSREAYECTVTADCAVFGFQDGMLKLLLVKRAIEPFKDYWLMPGGVVQENETIEEAADRVLHNLTNISNIHHEQVKCYSSINRHPVKRVISISFYALVKPENHPAIAKKHVSDIKWMPIDEIPELGFDHNQMAKEALDQLKRNLETSLLFGELLPEKFTLKELQNLYETILDEKLDRRNFRKRIIQTGLLQNTGEIKKGHKGGPELYELTKKTGSN